jgi:NAD(P)H-dependent FMN reductase
MSKLLVIMGSTRPTRAADRVVPWLKNAIDSVWLSFGFRNKPVATLGYSAGIGGGIRSIEHPAQMFVEADAVPLRNATIIPFVNDAFDEQGRPDHHPRRPYLVDVRPRKSPRRRGTGARSTSGPGRHGRDHRRPMTS